MFWADKIAKEIIDSGKYKPYWVDDMKTPSGRIHVGSLRGVITHELVWRALENTGKQATLSYVFDDHDPMDALPIYLAKEKWGKYLGQPLFTVPSPEKTAENYAQYFAQDFIQVFNKLGCHPKIIWTSEFYKTCKMNEYIKLCLDKAEIIRKIYEELYKRKMASDWYPFQVVCPNCGKETTTKVTNWDGKVVDFCCNQDAVAYTRGCGICGRVSPFSDGKRYAGKLPWKVEWAVKWKVIGITVEGAGKDHMTAGGSHDVSKHVCKRVLNYPTPFEFAHEFFLINGKKMSSSKGLGTSAKEVSEIIPPYLTRFLFTRTDYRQTIEFDPLGSVVIPDLFDEYDRCWQAYNTNSDENLSRIFEYSQIDKIPGKNPKLFLPLFRDIANYIQHPTVTIEDKFKELKGGELTSEEGNILSEREKYAHIWIKNYAPDEYRFHMTDKLPKEADALTVKQKEYLEKVVGLLDQYTKPEELQLALYNLSKEMDIATKDAFAAIYTTFLGKKHGPKAAWFLLQYPKEKVIARLQEATKTPQGWLEDSPGVEGSIQTISRPDLFSIDTKVKNVYPSISIGIAIIKEVTIQKSNLELEKEKQKFLKNSANLTAVQIGEFPEVISYRKLYKEMGIDWHSRRPSPEALLRRVVLGKGLYTVNTCVDAYNLVVMKNRVSVGAFDFDQIKFPTVLRYANERDEILLLGDKKPTKYTAKELAYFDKSGGYNIDFNFRDAQRTMVTEKTKNIWINVDGIYDISSELVQKSLKESVEMIVKYCGGEVEFEGVVA